MVTNPSIDDHKQALEESISGNFITIGEKSYLVSRNGTHWPIETIQMAIENVAAGKLDKSTLDLLPERLKDGSKFKNIIQNKFNNSKLKPITSKYIVPISIQSTNPNIIRKAVIRDNYLLFSISKIFFGNNKSNIGFGVFSKVYVLNRKDSKPRNLPENIKARLTNSIIGNTSKIGNIEIAQNDFPNKMNWDDANKACIELGDAWRLPTKDELNILYQNRYKIGGFSNNDYWSSTEVFKFFAWYQDFDNNLQDGINEYETFYVRAIRTF
jgi:hypothetical protein